MTSVSGARMTVVAGPGHILGPMPQFARRLITARHVPPVLPKQTVPVVALIAVTLSFVRGLDYATAPEPAGGSLQVLNALGQWGPFTIGIHMWGVALMTTAAFVWAAYLCIRIHLVVFASHVLIGSVYGGMVMAILQAGQLGESYAPIVAPLGGLIFHVLIGWRVKPFPAAGSAQSGVARDR